MQSKLAFTIGSYRLHDFINLGLKQIRTLSPDSPILVSDDTGPESAMIKQTTEAHGATYKTVNVRKGHFAGDFQAIVNSLAFAEAAGADVAVKISQRSILRLPAVIDVIQKTFSDPNILMATPGQPSIHPSANKWASGFAKFTTLTDMILIRSGSISCQELLEIYRARLRREKVPWASFIECTIDELHYGKFAGRTVKPPELTNPTADPIYLRRFQATQQQYQELAASHGFNGMFPLNEWGQIENRNYLCKPVVV